MKTLAPVFRAPPTAPVLHLSGPALREALDSLLGAAAACDGLEVLMQGLACKTALFANLLDGGRVRTLGEAEFLALCSFMPTVRRRIGEWLAQHGIAAMRTRLAALLTAPGEVEARFGDFLACFPEDRGHRWVRDLAAETLHFTAPEEVPLMTRWMWDRRTATGVLREIWHGETTALDAFALPDRLPTFLAMRAEIAGFLRDNGFFRDLALFQDLFCAHIYAGYINDRGGSYLNAEFSGGEDPLRHTRRLLGLDALVENGPRLKVRLPAQASAPGRGAARLGHSGEGDADP